MIEMNRRRDAMTRSRDYFEPRTLGVCDVFQSHLFFLLTTMSSSFLDQYESLDVIGNGSFGIIRKVRRKTDGLVSAALPLRHKTLMFVVHS